MHTEFSDVVKTVMFISIFLINYAYFSGIASRIKSIKSRKKIDMLVCEKEISIRVIKKRKHSNINIIEKNTPIFKDLKKRKIYEP